MTEKSKISIIISVLNAGQTLQRCFNSIAGQTYKNWELLVFDGASTDNTIEIIKKNEHIITFWQSETDNGVYSAWNKALKHVTGEWVYFIGADDYLWQEDVLASIAKHVQRTHFKVVYGHVNVVTENGKVIQELGQPWEVVKKEFLNTMSIPHQGVFHSCELFTKYGHFDEDFRICGDYEFLMRHLKTQDAHFVSIIVTGMGNEGMSNKLANQKCLLEEIIKAQAKHNIIRSPIYKTIKLLKLQIRKCFIAVLGPIKTLELVNAYRTFTGKPKAQ